MYGLPFYGFTGAPQNPPPGPAATPHGIDPGTNGTDLDIARLPLIEPNIQQDSTSGLFVDSGTPGHPHPDGTTYTQNGATLTAGTLSVFYRPIQPTVSEDVTINDLQKLAHGAWIRSLTTQTVANVTPVKSYPLVHSTDDRPALNFPSIYFPANIVTVNPDSAFGQERDTAVVNLGKFFPNDTGDLSKGTEQFVKSVGVDIGYSASPDVKPPQITQVGAVKTGLGTFKAFVRATDGVGGSGLNRVAVLYNTGDPVWGVQALTFDPFTGLWTGTITTASTVNSIRLDAEAQDNAANVGTSFNKAVNFQSTTDSTGPTITLDRPLPNAALTLNNQVASSFFCSDPGGIASCVGRSDAGPDQVSGNPIATDILGPHTFTVTAMDLSGNRTTKTVSYYVLGIFGFKPPVDNPPVLNVVNAGSTVPVKWTLKDAIGNFYRSLGSVTSVSSKAINCTAGTDPDPDVVASGLAGLKYDLTNEQFVYNWPTQKSWKGTCRRLVIGLVGNGVLPYADFQFK